MSEPLDIDAIKQTLPPLGFWSLTGEKTIYALIGEVERLRQQLDKADEALGFGYFPSDGTGRVSAIHELRNVSAPSATLDAFLAGVDELIINANRLCDRQLGGTYEQDCRTSLDRVKGARAAYRHP